VRWVNVVHIVVCLFFLPVCLSSSLFLYLCVCLFLLIFLSGTFLSIDSLCGLLDPVGL